jgi:hypothetical protein
MSKAKSKMHEAPKPEPKRDDELSDDALSEVAGGTNVGSKLATVADMTSEAQKDLQDATATQQRSIQMLSNILKKDHENKQSIIRNLKG